MREQEMRDQECPRCGARALDEVKCAICGYRTFSNEMLWKSRVTPEDRGRSRMRLHVRLDDYEDRTLKDVFSKHFRNPRCSICLHTKFSMLEHNEEWTELRVRCLNCGKDRLVATRDEGAASRLKQSMVLVERIEAMAQSRRAKYDHSVLYSNAEPE